MLLLWAPPDCILVALVPRSQIGQRPGRLCRQLLAVNVPHEPVQSRCPHRSPCARGRLAICSAVRVQLVLEGLDQVLDPSQAVPDRQGDLHTTICAVLPARATRQGSALASSRLPNEA